MNRNQRILIAEPQSSAREYLKQQCLESGYNGPLTEAKSYDHLQLLLTRESFDLCLIGTGFDERSQALIISGIVKSGQHQECALVPVSHRQDNDLLIAYIRAGAHGLLLQPISHSSFTTAITSALKVVQRSSKAQGKNSVVTLLDTFAHRLEQIAKRLKAIEAQGKKVDTSPKAIKEALLSTIATSEQDEDSAVEHVIRLLLKSR